MFNFLNLLRAKLVPSKGGKDFAEDLTQFTRWIAEGKNFSLSRFGDGEMMIINGQFTDLADKHHGEHTYIPENEQDERQRHLLHASLVHHAKNYYVGIACPCCVGKEMFYGLKEQSKQPEAHLTWANIFVNSNFSRFKKHTVPHFSNRRVFFIAHKAADTDGLPFKVETTFRVGSNAWVQDHDRLLGELTEYIKQHKVENALFLFSAGVLSNILTYELNKLYPNNTYLDMGSVFDIELGLGKTRGYLRKGKRLRQTCVWG